MEPIITFAMENLGFAAIVGILLILIIAVNQKKMMPFVYHSVECVVYFLAFHYLFWLGVSVANWYANETNPTEGFGFKTPGGLLSQNFADKALYTPVSLFYFEVAMAVLILYLVIVIRPTSYSGKNKYKGDSERGMEPRKGRGAPRYDRTRAKAHRNK